MFGTYSELRVGDWLARFASFAVAALALLLSTDHKRREGPAFWCWSASALSLAALAPVAMESSGRMPLPGIGFVLAAVTTAISARATGALATTAAAAGMAGAAACGLTGMLWPLGYAWAAIGLGQRVRRGIVLLVAAMIGAIAGRALGWPAFAGGRTISSVHAAHRDMMILLPVILVGLAGYARGCRRPEPMCRKAGVPWLAGWTGAAVIGLGVALAGGPLDVCTCVLPFWWWAPTGLADLADVVTASRTRGWALRGIGWASGLVLAVLAIGSAGRWLDGPLLALYLVSKP